MFVVPGMGVDAGELRQTLDRLRASLSAPSLPMTGGAGLGLDRERVASSLKLLLEEVDRTDLATVQVLSGLVREYRPQAQAETLRDLFAALQDGWRQFVSRSFGKDKMLAMYRLLSSPAPDLLRILGREDDENSHSDLIAWLLSPGRAPTIAKSTLTELTSHLENPDLWRSRIESAVDADLVSVRREMLIARDLGGGDDLCRVDIVVSGPGFVLAIENKVWAHEHWDQTTLYWSWLEPMTCLRAGVFLSPGGLTASSPHFQPVSYLALVAALLEGPAQHALSPAEEIVLSSYLKTLQRHILPVEIKAAIAAVQMMEGT
jgi:hypothetical protein